MRNLRSSTRLVGKERRQVAARLRKRYEAGESTNGLQADTGYSLNLVRRLLVEAGTEIRGRPPAGRFLRGQERRKIAAEFRRRYEAGATVAKLANDIDGCEARVRNLLREAGYKPAPAERRNGKRARRAKEARRRHEAGESVSELATRLGCSPDMVRALIREAGGQLIRHRTPPPAFLELVRQAKLSLTIAEAERADATVAVADARWRLGAAVAAARANGGTLRDIGAAIGVSGERARQLERGRQPDRRRRRPRL